MNFARHHRTVYLLALLSPGCGVDITYTDHGSAAGADFSDLFSCDIEVACVVNEGHLGYVSIADRRCMETFVGSGQAGAILRTAYPGPYPTRIDTIQVFLGNGKMYEQSRWRCESDDACDGQSTSQWSLKRPYSCDVQMSVASPSICGMPDAACEPVVDIVNCVSTEENLSCGALAW